MGELVEFLVVMAGAIGVPMVAVFAVPPIAKAFARRIERGGAPDGAALAELDALRAEVESLRELAPRLVELEERVDFAERLLAQRTEPGLFAPAPRSEA